MELYKILRVKKELLEELERTMEEVTGRSGVIKKLEDDLERLIEERLAFLGFNRGVYAKEVVGGLTQKIAVNEDELYQYLDLNRNNLVLEKVIELALKINTEKYGFFLKKDKAEDILRKNPPRQVLDYLGYSSVEELLVSEDIMEIFSALRFIETDEWMHQTFEGAYNNFGPHDFERRPMELKILGRKWGKAGRKFAAKKHHNVSHLKEFGVVFLNPINQTQPGALLRDFALFLHYFHEIAFYSRLFEKYQQADNFAERVKSLLRGDLPEKMSVGPGEWLIIQRYLWKENSDDPRLFLPRVNPEALHWYKGEMDLVKFGRENSEVNLDFWENLDSVGGYFKSKSGKEELVSFDLEDNAMTFAMKQEGIEGKFWYHQQEALWNELFRRYLGQEKMEELLMDNFEKGIVLIK